MPSLTAVEAAAKSARFGGRAVRARKAKTSATSPRAARPEEREAAHNEASVAGASGETADSTVDSTVEVGPDGVWAWMGAPAESAKAGGGTGAGAWCGAGGEAKVSWDEAAEGERVLRGNGRRGGWEA